MYLNFQKIMGREAKSEWEKERSVEKRRNINSLWTHKKNCIKAKNTARN